LLNSIRSTYLTNLEIEAQIRIGLEGKEQFGLGSLKPLLTRQELTPGASKGQPAVFQTGTVSLLNGPRASIITIRVYTVVDLITINIDYYLAKGDIPLLSLQVKRRNGKMNDLYLHIR